MSAGGGGRIEAQTFASKAFSLLWAASELVGGVQPPPPTSPTPMPAKEQVRTRSAFSKVTYLLVLGNARTKYQIPKDKWVRRGSKSSTHPCT